jgi:hypothetical protein
MKRSQIATAQNVGELRADLLIVFADLAGRSHLMQLQLQSVMPLSPMAGMSVRCGARSLARPCKTCALASQPIAIQHNGRFACAQIT